MVKIIDGVAGKQLDTFLIKSQTTVPTDLGFLGVFLEDIKHFRSGQNCEMPNHFLKGRVTMKLGLLEITYHIVL